VVIASVTRIAINLGGGHVAGINAALTPQAEAHLASARRRRHSSLGRVSPINYERQYLANAA
jgi:transposase InsO family protein